MKILKIFLIRLLPIPNQTEESGHGREEIRNYWMLTNVNKLLDPEEKWKNFSSVGMVCSERIVNGKRSHFPKNEQLLELTIAFRQTYTKSESLLQFISKWLDLFNFTRLDRAKIRCVCPGYARL